MKEIKNQIAGVVAKYLNAQYKFGARGVDGYDCYSFLYCFLKDLGLNVPEDEDYPIDNYIKKFEANPDESKKYLSRRLKRLGKKIDKNYMQPGDIVLLENEGLAAMIYIGRGNFIGMHAPYGVVVAPRESLKLDNIKVRRLCHKHCQ